MRMIWVRMYDSPELPKFAQGGIVQAAEHVRRHGRAGDDVLVHVNEHEFKKMQDMWGEPSYNPHTGLPEYGFWSKIKHAFKKIAPYAGIIAAIAFPALAPALGGMLGASGAAAGALGSGVIGAAGGALGGGGWKGAAAGALTGGAAGGGGAMLGNAAGLTGQAAKIAGNAALTGAASEVKGGDFTSGALMGGALTAATPYINNDLAKTGVGQKMGLSYQDPTIDYDPSQLQLQNTSAEYMPEPGAVDASGAAGDALQAQQVTADYMNDPVQQSTTDNLVGKGYNYMKNNPVKTAAAAGALAQQAGMADAPVQAPNPYGVGNTNESLPQYAMNRRQNITQQPPGYYTYGEMPQPVWDPSTGGAPPDEAFPIEGFAHGGAAGGAHHGALSTVSRYVKQGTGASGIADNIDAKLSENEYVFDSRSVALLGDGNPDAGAKKLDAMRVRIRQHAGKALAKGKIPPKSKDAMHYLGAK
jgi:hypothetical protein